MQSGNTLLYSLAQLCSNPTDVPRAETRDIPTWQTIGGTRTYWEEPCLRWSPREPNTNSDTDVALESCTGHILIVFYNVIDKGSHWMYNIVCTNVFCKLYNILKLVKIVINK